MLVGYSKHRGDSMHKRIFISIMICFLVSSSIRAENIKRIEIFHINEGKIIKIIPTTLEIQKELEFILGEINDLYRGLEPIPHQGYLIKIPLQSAFKLENKWFNDYVIEVIFIFPEYENPYLMILDDENNPHFFTFTVTVDSILSKLEFKPNPAN